MIHSFGLWETIFNIASFTLALLLILVFQGDVFLWIEVLSAVGTPRLKEFNTKVADAWLAIKMKVSAFVLNLTMVRPKARASSRRGWPTFSAKGTHPSARRLLFFSYNRKQYGSIVYRSSALYRSSVFESWFSCGATHAVRTYLVSRWLRRSAALYYRNLDVCVVSQTEQSSYSRAPCVMRGS